jgi:hypothetical protein
MGWLTGVRVVVPPYASPPSDAQVEVARCAEALCALVPDAVHMQSGVLVTALHANLGHQRSPVRQATLAAMGRLLVHSAEGVERVMREVVLEDLRALGFDRAAAVRVQLCGVLRQLLVALPVRGLFDGPLVGLLLARAADDTSDVRAAALAGLVAAAEVLAAAPDYVEFAGVGGGGGGEAGAGASASASASVSASGVGGVGGSLAPLPHPFQGPGGLDGFPVPPACRTVLGKLLGGLVAAALKGMEDWKAGVRKSAAGQLRCVWACDRVRVRLSVLVSVSRCTCRFKCRCADA